MNENSISSLGGNLSFKLTMDIIIKGEDTTYNGQPARRMTYAVTTPANGGLLSGMDILIDLNLSVINGQVTGILGGREHMLVNGTDLIITDENVRKEGNDYILDPANMSAAGDGSLTGTAFNKMMSLEKAASGLPDNTPLTYLRQEQLKVSDRYYDCWVFNYSTNTGGFDELNETAPGITDGINNEDVSSARMDYTSWYSPLCPAMPLKTISYGGNGSTVTTTVVEEWR